MANKTLDQTANELIKKVQREFYGPYIIQNNSTAVPAGDLVTDEYTIYPKSAGSYYDASGRFYMVPDTVYGPRLLRPLIHQARERQHPLKVNYWDVIKSITSPQRGTLDIPQYLKINSQD